MLINIKFLVMKNLPIHTLLIGASAGRFGVLDGGVVCTGIRFLRTPRQVDA